MSAASAPSPQDARRLRKRGSLTEPTKGKGNARNTVGCYLIGENTSERFEPLLHELFPVEQARIVQLLVERVDVGIDGVDIRLRTERLSSLVTELGAINPESRKAA